MVRPPCGTWSWAWWPGPSGRPRVAGPRGRACRTRGSFRGRRGAGCLQSRSCLFADVDTLARARAGGGRLGPRRGRWAAEEVRTRARGPLGCAGGAGGGASQGCSPVRLGVSERGVRGRSEKECYLRNLNLKITKRSLGRKREPHRG